MERPAPRDTRIENFGENLNVTSTWFDPAVIRMEKLIRVLDVHIHGKAL